MFRDFTLSSYKNLCEGLIKSDFEPVRVDSYIESSEQPNQKRVILRHDVDKNPENSLKMAELEESLGISSTYYFRIIEGVFNENIISKIHDLGHEIGYHYEVLAKNDGDFGAAFLEFKANLKKFSKIVPVRTICMHGSPISKWRDYDLWDHFSYDSLSIIGEAFLTIDYNRVHYFTDTGRQWNNQKSNIRDEVVSDLKAISVRSTKDLIKKLKWIDLDISINTHPQRWHDSYLKWQWEFISQNLKNVGKSFIKLSRRKQS